MITRYNQHLNQRNRPLPSRFSLKQAQLLLLELLLYTWKSPAADKNGVGRVIINLVPLILPSYQSFKENTLQSTVPTTAETTVWFSSETFRACHVLFYSLMCTN